MPISAFGNVQELLLILDEHWSNHPELHNIPIYYASGLAFRGMQVYRTYIHTMNDHVKSRFSRDRNDNPFAFKYVRNVKDFRKWKDSGPCVMMATPQMLQGYHSRELLENWAPDRKNGLVITGYSIEGTMAKVSSSFDVVAGWRGGGQHRRVGAWAVRYGNPPMTNMNHRRERQIPCRCRSHLLDQSSPYSSVPDLQYTYSH
jgi:cleavage and polyadenylation specificity factor subunit 3